MTHVHQGHRARKRFGQNFLTSTLIIEQIIRAIAPRQDDLMVEIGPGLGALTHVMTELLSHLHVVELDRDLVARLQAHAALSQKLTVHQADALQFDFAQLATESQKLRIVGNLPYNISTPLLFHLLGVIDCIHDMHFMLQKEVVNRLCAQPGNKNYGRLSIMTQYFCHTTTVLHVPPDAFSPPPKVDSAVVRLTPIAPADRPPVDVDKLRQICTLGFSMRRKTLRNNFKDLLSIKDFQHLNIDAQARPETLSIQDFIRITQYVTDRETQ